MLDNTLITNCCEYTTESINASKHSPQNIIYFILISNSINYQMTNLGITGICFLS